MLAILSDVNLLLDNGIVDTDDKFINGVADTNGKFTVGPAINVNLGRNVTTGGVVTGGQFARVSTMPAVNVPPVSCGSGSWSFLKS